MRTKHKYSIRNVYGYCRWNTKYPPDDWCIFGISKFWHNTKLIRFGFCFFGFELRVNINREYK